MNLRRHRSNWEDLADLDPNWAVLTEPGKRYGGWNRDEFERSGREEIDGLMANAEVLGFPAERHRALDFGCGPGRLSRALALYFDDVVGIDISCSMVRQARERNSDKGNCGFEVNDKADLALFDDCHFDLIYTNLVLQHVPTRAAVLTYIDEFVRTLRPGGLLVFQVTTSLPTLGKIQPRRRLYDVLRTVGLSPAFLYGRLKLHPIRMTAVPKTDVEARLSAAGAKQMKTERHLIDGIESVTYYAGR